AAQERARTLPSYRASLIICTCRRPAALLRCLTSLLSCPSGLDEVIVVDNDPDASDLPRELEAFPGVTYVRERQPGLSHARNAGIRVASGDIILFTDDDVVVHRDWPLRILRCFDDPAVLAATGLVMPAELETGAQTAFEWDLGGFGQGFRPIRYDAAFFAAGRDRGVPVWRIGCGANMALRRAAFEKVGLFDTRLGAGAAGCSEDSELWYRLLATGHVCQYEPSAVVFHYHRRDWQSLRRQAHDYMRGHVVALFVQFWRYRHWGNLWRVFVALPCYYGRLVYRRLRHPRDASRQLLGAHVSGMLAGVAESIRLWWKGAGATPGGGAPEIKAKQVHAAR
ncbi:MAG: glycosyltransferase family 2 protein, partial [Gemmatimonadaceae bacterium]